MTSQTEAVRWGEISALIVILAVAGGLRFGWAGVNSYAWDEARISLDALRMARGGEFVLAGQPSSVDIPFFPASVWAFALPFAISADPLLATLTVGLVSWLCVVGVWGLARRWGALPGLMAALFMAASPYAVFYGRSIWQPNLLAPLALAWLWVAWLAITAQSGQRRGVGASFVVGLLGVLTVQIHFAGVALAVMTAYVVVRFLRGRRMGAAVIGGGVGALATLPYLYYLTVVNPALLARFGSVIGGETAYDLSGFANLARLALGWDWAFLGMGDGDLFSRDPRLAGLVGVCLGAGIIALLSRWRALTGDTEGRTHRRFTELLLVACFTSPLFFIRHSTPVLIHYQLVTLPVVAVIFGAAVSLLRARWWRVGVTVASVLVAGVWTVQISATLNYATQYRPANSALSSILSESRTAAYTPDAPILFFTHGHDPALDGEAAVFKTLLWERDHRILNGDALLVLPPYRATLMATLAPFQMWEELITSGSMGEITHYPRREGALPFVATDYDGRGNLSGFTPVAPVALADGTTLTAWRARYVGERLRISTVWQVGADAPAAIYQQFHHLRTSDTLEGEPSWVADVPLSRQTLRTGDTVVVMADFFDAPANAALFIDIGHYTLPDVARVPGAQGGAGVIRLGPFVAGR